MKTAKWDNIHDISHSVMIESLSICGRESVYTFKYEAREEEKYPIEL